MRRTQEGMEVRGAATSEGTSGRRGRRSDEASRLAAGISNSLRALKMIALGYSSPVSQSDMVAVSRARCSWSASTHS